MEGINLIKINGKHICKCHSVSPCVVHIIVVNYMLIKEKKVCSMN
jgi:hypothetical protein